MGISLYYFDVRGLAEPIRMILSYGGEKFEDVRISLESNPAPIPADIKSKCTWGQVPLVEFEGKKLTQSVTIARYFAKKHGLVPKDDFEAAQADEYVDACKDFIYAWMPVAQEKDEEAAKKLTQEIYTTCKSRFLAVFDQAVEKNGGKYVVGKCLTWADIYLAHVITHLEIYTGIDMRSEFPALKTHVDVVFAVPGIKEWVEKRPKTKF